MSHLVSILMPMYNAEKWISITIDSVLNQSYTNWELIIIDDGSTDGGFKVVNKLAQKESRIKVYQQENKGACVARNKAFECSKGSLIQYLDADDLIASSKIEVQVETLKNQLTDGISFGIWTRIDEHGNELPLSKSGTIYKNYEKPINLLIDSWSKREMVPIHSWLTHRDLISKAGSWNEQLKHNQDGEFFSRVVSHASRIIHCPQAKVYYRSNLTNSISSQALLEKNAASQLRSYQLYVKNLEMFISDKRVRVALAYNFLMFIYRFYYKYPKLVKQAEHEFRNLKVGRMWAVGGKNFKAIAKVIGFKNALKIKSLLT